MKTYPLYLNGEFVETDNSIDVINPSNGEAFARVSTVDRARVTQALQDAQASFDGWRKLTGMARADFIYKIIDALQARTDELAGIIVKENGKPLPQAKGEIGMTIDHLRWYAEEARRGYGRTIPHQQDGKRHHTIKTPIGVAAAIAPWNFPLVLAVRKIAPALAAGCPVILKPASATPLSSIIFAEACHEAGLPKGVFQLVCGKASEISAEFLENPICRKISFTGSTEVGRILIEGAARDIKPLSLELGGHSPVLIFDDADLETAVEGTMVAKFRNTGQSCIAANRIYVQKGIYDRFMEAFLERVKAMKVGDGFEEGVEIGAMIDEKALNNTLSHIEEAQAKGAKLICGGKRIGSTGAFMEPAVLTDVPDDAMGMCDESFGPVAYINTFETEEEAVTRANDTRYGLAAYAFTADMSRTFRLMEELEAGMICFNDGVPTTTQCPFGGVKQSGWNRELGIEGMDAFMETKHICLKV
ncbi:MAG: succinate-semialdehyde dehydrogenase/glutarate-semialdehyde dehydrogenase [Limisphaerales bacterium]|jgi:succinate-semialdehyde dehydrogenase/glutarate-semialdehyde dehydrogenase